MFRKTWFVGFVSVFIMFSSLVAFGATKSPRSTVSESTQTMQLAQDKSAQLTVGPVIGVFGNSGKTAAGTNVGILARVASNTPLYVGLDLGVHFWGTKVREIPSSLLPQNTSSVTGLQFLPTAIYQFDISTIVHPYGGISAGPYVTVGNTTQLAYCMLFRPGFNFTFSHTVGLNSELKFGQLVGEFVVFPSLSLLLTL